MAAACTIARVVDRCFRTRSSSTWNARWSKQSCATNLVVQAMDVQLCDTSEDEDENMESELESDEISEDERHYE